MDRLRIDDAEIKTTRLDGQRAGVDRRKTDAGRGSGPGLLLPLAAGQDDRQTANEYESTHQRLLLRGTCSVVLSH